MTLQIILYNFFSASAVFFAFAIMAFNSPISSILCLVLSLLSTIVLLFMIHVEFLAYIYLIVYVGAIVILFLFVLMLLNIRESQSPQVNVSFNDPVFHFLIVVKLLCLWYQITKHETLFYRNLDFSYVAALQGVTNDVLMIGLFLYTDYFFNFILVSVILLISMIGTVVLASNKSNVRN